MPELDVSSVVKKYGGVLGKGLFGLAAPSVGKGILVEILVKKKVSVEEAIKWVEGNTCLWDIIEPKQQDQLKMVAKKVGRLDWLTTDWFIDAIKQDLPSLASLFLGWTKASNWLTRQIEIVKKKITS